MEKVDKKINEFLKDILGKVGKPGFNMVEVMEGHLMKAYSKEEKEQYFKYKNALNILRQELDRIPEITLLDSVIKESKEKGVNRKLNSDEVNIIFA